MTAMTVHSTYQSAPPLLPGEESTFNSLTSSPAFESAVKSYAARVLRINSPPEACFDSSVASYIISALQSAFLDSPALYETTNVDFSVENLDEYQSMVELLEDNCNMNSSVACSSLRTIAKAVRTGIFDSDIDAALQKNFDSASQDDLRGMMNFGGSHVESRLGRYRTGSVGNESDDNCESLDPISLLSDMLRKSGSGESSLFPTMGSSSKSAVGDGMNKDYEPSFLLETDTFLGTLHQDRRSVKHSTPTTSEETSIAEELSALDKKSLAMSCNKVTQLQPDMLIPEGLLGSMDESFNPIGNTVHDKFDSMSNEIAPNIANGSCKVSNFLVHPDSSTEKSSISTYNRAISASEESSKPVKAPKNTMKKKKSKAKSKDLAAALFCSRPRSNSVQADKSPKLKPAVAPSVPSSRMFQRSLNPNGDEHAIFETQVDSTVQCLMAMNYDICEEAAYEAALVSNSDVNVAQHVIDGAVSAPPVCRHMLNDGCYRSDCQFSHDVDGHTCSFWLRGRCGKGSSCRFMHGFSSKLLEGVKDYFLADQALSQSPTNSTQSQFCVTDEVSKAIPIKTANLVQYNMKTFFMSEHRVGGLTTFQSAPAQEITSFPPSGSGPSFTCLPAATSETFLPYKDYNSSEVKSAHFSSLGETNGKLSANSFARIASNGYNEKSSFSPSCSNNIENFTYDNQNSKTIRIPQNLWNACHNRSSAAFYIDDPIARYEELSTSFNRDDIVDLHFQSVKTFSIVLSTILPKKTFSAW